MEQWRLASGAGATGSARDRTTSTCRATGIAIAVATCGDPVTGRRAATVTTGSRGAGTGVTDAWSGRAATGASARSTATGSRPRSYREPTVRRRSVHARRDVPLPGDREWRRRQGIREREFDREQEARERAFERRVDRQDMTASERRAGQARLRPRAGAPREALRRGTEPQGEALQRAKRERGHPVARDDFQGRCVAAPGGSPSERGAPSFLVHATALTGLRGSGPTGFPRPAHRATTRCRTPCR